MEQIHDKYFTGSHEIVYCSHFGCRQVLSLRQQMAGDRCLSHPRKATTSRFDKPVSLVEKRDHQYDELRTIVLLRLKSF